MDRLGAAGGRLSQRALRALFLVVLSGLAVGVMSAPALADGPGVGTSTIVSVGDSYISGEAGRWAGNTNGSASNIDALGSTAYFDNSTNSAELIYRCHRSKSAEVFIGGGIVANNLSCSGAKTSTFVSSDGYFKPGLDFYNGSAGQGQALKLQSYAATHNVKMISLSIGGNNFNFASIVQSCVSDFLLSPSWWKDYCYDDSSVKANFTATNITNQTAAIKTAILNINQAMTNAGYNSSQFAIVVQDYMSPIPNGAGYRYSESGYTRQSTGGCGFWNRDADWANNTALPTINNAVKTAAAQTGLGNVKILELQSAFNGRRLCENTVGLLEEVGLANWTSTGAVDKSEWINQIRTVSTAFSDYYIQESLHPNYWGQLAMRNCTRQAFNGGTPRGGNCVRSANGRNAQGEPNMTVQ